MYMIAARLIQKMHTPAHVQAWLTSLSYNPTETMHGFHGVVETKKAHCLEGALSAATILEHYGFPPLILDLQSKDYLDHTLFIFQHHGRWGAVGKSRDVGLDGRKAVFKTVRALVQSYAAAYIDDHAELFGYGVLDLRSVSPRWRTSRRGLWYIEETLRTMPHQRFRTPPSFLKYWRTKQHAWRLAHPNTPFPSYPQQQTWL